MHTYLRTPGDQKIQNLGSPATLVLVGGMPRQTVWEHRSRLEPIHVVFLINYPILVCAVRGTSGDRGNDVIA